MLQFIQPFFHFLFLSSPCSHPSPYLLIPIFRNARMLEVTMLKKYGPENLAAHYGEFDTICDATQVGHFITLCCCSLPTTRTKCPLPPSVYCLIVKRFQVLCIRQKLCFLASFLQKRVLDLHCNKQKTI